MHSKTNAFLLCMSIFIQPGCFGRLSIPPIPGRENATDFWSALSNYSIYFAGAGSLAIAAAAIVLFLFSRPETAKHLASLGLAFLGTGLVLSQIGAYKWVFILGFWLTAIGASCWCIYSRCKIVRDGVEKITGEDYNNNGEVGS